MTLQKLVETARILLADKANVEYVSGICHLLAEAFPVETVDRDERAKEIESMIFQSPLERAVAMIEDYRSLINTIVNDGVNTTKENDILYRIDIENGRSFLLRTQNFKDLLTEKWPLKVQEVCPFDELRRYESITTKDISEASTKPSFAEACKLIANKYHLNSDNTNAYPELNKQWGSLNYNQRMQYLLTVLMESEEICGKALALKHHK